MFAGQTAAPVALNLQLGDKVVAQSSMLRSTSLRMALLAMLLLKGVGCSTTAPVATDAGRDAAATTQTAARASDEANIPVGEPEFDIPPWDIRKKRPWDFGAPIIIDAFHRNAIDWELMKTDANLVAVIHKATEGRTFTDPKFAQRRQTAKRYGYLWGSYHLGRPGYPRQQADKYLSLIDPKTELVVLDVEGISKHDMSLKEAEIFVKHVHQRIGRYPILYVNYKVADKISARKGSVLKQCPLWLARFREDLPYMPKAWPKYTLWQFSSEINCKAGEKCLYTVPGTAYDMDVNVYWGTKSNLIKHWPNLWPTVSLYD